MARPPIIAPTIVRFSMHHRGFGPRPFFSVLDVSVDETGVSRNEACVAVAPDVVRVYQENVCGNLPNGTAFLDASWLDLDSEDGTTGSVGPQPGQPVAGGPGVSFAPPNVNILAHLQCVHTRSQRNGRKFFPAVAEGEVDNGGLLSAGIKTLWLNGLNGLRSDLADLSATAFESVAWRVVHVEGHTGTPVPGFPNGYPNAWSSSDVDSISIDALAATQRRRLRD